MKKFIKIFCVFLFTILTVTSCQKSQTSRPQLIVGLQAGYPPFESINEKGEVIGFDVDIAQELAESLGKDLKIVEMGFDGLILGLKNKKIDLIVSGVSITHDRLQKIAMVPYFGEDQKELTLLFWQTSSNIKSFDELNGQVVAVQSGNFQADIINSYKNVQVKELENVTDLIMDIQYGKSFAALVEPKTAQEMISHHPDLIAVNIPLKEDEQVMGFGIGIRPDDIQMIDFVTTEVKKLQNQQKIKALADKWFKGVSQP
ncbi:MAG: transporter substrate-binding domain-containing protein [Parachlamydiales bacterium]|nr:transporter substrate-binding domain-containing protein [Parachlamydiales bacterium]